MVIEYTFDTCPPWRKSDLKLAPFESRVLQRLTAAVFESSRLSRHTKKKVACKLNLQDFSSSGRHHQWFSLPICLRDEPARIVPGTRGYEYSYALHREALTGPPSH